ncbi:MAG TPA: helix-turn-helix domain-containing protein, partial [Ktedonobacterales bacterium]|nr:helix-turn-helix domain-containing protein [Ktedonobacterales bacterium]
LLHFRRKEAGMMEKKRQARVETLRGELLRRMSAAMGSGDAGKIVAMANLVKLMGVALASLPADAEVDPTTLTLTSGQVAQALGFHPEHVRRLLRGGSLAGERVGRDYQVPLPALITWLDRQRNERKTLPFALSPLLGDLPLEPTSVATWQRFLARQGFSLYQSPEPPEPPEGESEGL